MPPKLLYFSSLRLVLFSCSLLQKPLSFQLVSLDFWISMLLCNIHTTSNPLLICVQFIFFLSVSSHHGYVSATFHLALLLPCKMLPNQNLFWPFFVLAVFILPALFSVPSSHSIPDAFRHTRPWTSEWPPVPFAFSVFPSLTNAHNSAKDRCVVHCAAVPSPLPELELALFDGVLSPLANVHHVFLV